MKIIFAGTSDFAMPTLQALFASKHTICAIFTNPDRPAGRGLKPTPSVVKLFAVAHQLPLFQPESLRDPKVQQEVRALQAEVLIDVAYGLFLPKEVFTIPRYGSINIHPSLLPRWRGAAPIPRAIIAGDRLTGVTIMQIDAGLDTGDILKQAEVPIENSDTTGILLEKTAKIGAKLLLEVLAEAENKHLGSIPQDNDLATIAPKISKEEARINWQLSAVELARIVRAFNPWPIAFAEFGAITLRIWEAEALPLAVSTQDPGTVVAVTEDGALVTTGQGMLILRKIQLPGKKVMSVREVLRGHPKLFAV
jgi:methionyl-tRNA formyltransferase